MKLIFQVLGSKTLFKVGDVVKELKSGSDRIGIY